jgi:hypothetical protein
MVFLMTLCAAYAHPIEDKVVAEYRADEKRKHAQKINRTNALSIAGNIVCLKTKNMLVIFMAWAPIP